MKLFLEWIHSFIHYIKKHPFKVGVIALISIIISVFYQYSIRFPLLQTNNKYSSNGDDTENEGSGYSWAIQSKKSANNNKMLKNAQRSRLLLRVRKQFDLACKSFLPTLRKRIFETIDINHTIRKIKELRTATTINSSTNTNSQKQGNSPDLENELWEDVKISSFGQMFSTIYLLSAVCTLLRVQLHVLARHLIKTEKLSSHNSTNPSSVSFAGSDDDVAGLDGEMFRLIVDGTYRQMFGNGMQSFSFFLMEKLKIHLSDWTVREKVKVDYEEVRELFEKVRREIELHFDVVTKDLFLPPEAEPVVSPSGSGIFDQTIRFTPAAQRLLNQIWDVVESPVFQVVYLETVDSCYRLCYDHLRKLIFQPESSPSPGYETSSPASFRSPPLASILPQLKSISNRLLPDSPDTPLNSDLRNLSSGTLLDSLCISIFDAEED